MLCITMANPWIFPYQQSPTIYSSPLVAMLSFHFPLSSTPYLYDWSYMLFHCDAAHRQHILHIHFMLSFTLLYFILLCHVHCRLYVHTCNPLFST